MWVRRYEILITELVHARDVTRQLIDKNVKSKDDFEWLYRMRHYWNATGSAAPGRSNLLQVLEFSNLYFAGALHARAQVRVCDAVFEYGFEYLGVGERLVQTPLTDRCYLTMTQVRHTR